MLSFLFPCVYNNIGLAGDNWPVRVRLVPASHGIGKQDTVMAGVEFEIDSGWKIFGLPLSNGGIQGREPVFEWSETANIKNITIIWPHPLVEREKGRSVSVYRKRVVIPVALDVDKPDEPLRLSGKVSFVACNDQCVPMDVKLRLDIPLGPATPTTHAREIMEFQTQNEFAGANMSLWAMVLVALAGGLVLNFMPCVLPVLSLKLKTIIKGASRAATSQTSWKLDFLATVAGILASFLVMALIALVLQASGKVFGWGMHFQEPIFIVFMAILMVLFAANLWGLFDISLPWFIQKRINAIVGHHRTGQFHIILEGFISGVFATLLATPCTAPFLGSALGYALSRGAVEILILFMALGVGFSAPYILGIVLPLRYLPVPKPGKWMERTGKFLAAGLLMTCLWLLWILDKSKGLFISLGVAFFLVLLVIILAKTQRHEKKRYLGWFCVVGAFLVPWIPVGGGIFSRGQLETETHWKVFSQDSIKQALDAGHIVFVDVTASWCTTCQINKMLVLEKEKVMKILSSPHVICLRADWTSQDDSIGYYLKKFGRFGIPFNIVYGPGAPGGIVLPELLSEKAVLEAFEAAGYRDVASRMNSIATR